MRGEHSLFSLKINKVNIIFLRFWKHLITGHEKYWSGQIYIFYVFMGTCPSALSGDYMLESKSLGKKGDQCWETTSVYSHAAI